MESIDVRVLRTVRDWRADGHRALLATVIKTWGSSPRPVGAMMALREDGRARMIAHFDETEASLARLRGPVGIHINSKTPAEIAVSVMAEILAVKNGVHLPRELSVAQAKQQQKAAVIPTSNLALMDY